MFYLLNSLWNYGKFFMKLRSYYYKLKDRSLDTITDSEINEYIQEALPYIDRCGCVCIKFTQWITPMLDIIINKHKKEPYWLRTLEKYYENCSDHSIKYTYDTYEKQYGEPLEQSYEIVDLIGSGSIGQVYKIKSIQKDEYFAMKVMHPNVHYDMWIFKNLVYCILHSKKIRDIIVDILPVDIMSFICDFERQIDMNHEANNLLKMAHMYKDNEYIIIPNLISFKNDIIIMDYQDGLSIDDQSISEYNKMKIVNLLSLFIKNNFELEFFNHGDLHKGNWKLQEYNNLYKLVFYDFGFCWKNKNKELAKILCDAFVDTTEDNIYPLAGVICLILDLHGEDIIEQIKQFVDEYLSLDSNSEFNPNSPKFLFTIAILLARKYDILVDINNLQSILLYIQIFKYLSMFGISDNTPNENTYRGNYIDSINICDTYGVFKDISDIIKDKLNQKQIEVDSIFSDITYGDEIKNLLKFD